MVAGFGFGGVQRRKESTPFKGGYFLCKQTEETRQRRGDTNEFLL